MPWNAIRYVSSGFTLLAFIAAIVLAIYRHSLKSRERLIELAPAEERARLVQRTLKEFFDVDTGRMTEAHAYKIAMEQIRARGRRYLVNAIIIGLVLLVSVVAVIAAYANRVSAKTVYSKPELIQVKIDAPKPDQTFPEKYRIPFSGAAFDPQYGELGEHDLS